MSKPRADRTCVEDVYGVVCLFNVLLGGTIVREEGVIVEKAVAMRVSLTYLLLPPDELVLECIVDYRHSLILCTAMRTASALMVLIMAMFGARLCQSSLSLSLSCLRICNVPTLRTHPISHEHLMLLLTTPSANLTVPCSKSPELARSLKLIPVKHGKRAIVGSDGVLGAFGLARNPGRSAGGSFRRVG